MKNRYTVKQLSIFLDNRRGRLLEVTQALEEKNINIRALAMAESAEFGILRLVVNKPEKAGTLLTEGGFTVKEQDVFAVEVEDVPGEFCNVVRILAEQGINIDYAYAFIGSSNKAVLIFRVADSMFDRALSALREGGIKLVDPLFFYD